MTGEGSRNAALDLAEGQIALAWASTECDLRGALQAGQWGCVFYAARECLRLILTCALARSGLTVELRAPLPAVLLLVARSDIGSADVPHQAQMLLKANPSDARAVRMLADEVIGLVAELPLPRVASSVDTRGSIVFYSRLGETLARADVAGMLIPGRLRALRNASAGQLKAWDRSIEVALNTCGYEPVDPLVVMVSPPVTSGDHQA